MKKQAGKDRCIICGDVVVVPEGKRSRTVISTTERGKVRIVYVDGVEIHRCNIVPLAG